MLPNPAPGKYGLPNVENLISGKLRLKLKDLGTKIDDRVPVALGGWLSIF